MSKKSNASAPDTNEVMADYHKRAGLMVPDDEYDFSDVKHGPTNDQMTALRDGVRELVKADKEVKDATLELDQAKKHLATYRDDVVPKQMATMGLTGKVDIDGYTLSAGDVLEGSLPKDPVEQAWAVAWLDSNGGGPLVKREITIELPRDAAAMEKAIYDFLHAKFPQAQVSSSLAVHHASLKSHVMEFIKKGVSVPIKQLGLTLLRRAKVIAAK